MIETCNPEINVEDLMKRIREEAERLPMTPVAFVEPTSGAAPPTLFIKPGEPIFAPKETYTLTDFLDVHDETFIRRAYREILRREPDAGGVQNYLEQLRAGRFSKVEILGRLRYSPEGRKKGVKVRGLLLPFVVATACRLPVMGYLLHWLISLLRLPTLARNFTRFENYTVWRLDQTGHLFNQNMADCKQSLARLDAVKANAVTLATALARIEALERRLEDGWAAPVDLQQPLDQEKK